MQNDLFLKTKLLALSAMNNSPKSREKAMTPMIMAYELYEPIHENKRPQEREPNNKPEKKEKGIEEYFMLIKSGINVMNEKKEMPSSIKIFG